MNDQKEKVKEELEKLMQSYPKSTCKLVWLAIFLLSVAIGAILLFRFLKGK